MSSMVRQANPFGPGLDSFFGTRTRGRGRAGSSARIMQLGLLLYQQIAMLENKPPVTMALVACEKCQWSMMCFFERGVLVIDLG